MHEAAGTPLKKIKNIYFAILNTLMNKVSCDKIATYKKYVDTEETSLKYFDFQKLKFCTINYHTENR